MNTNNYNDKKFNKISNKCLLVLCSVQTVYILNEKIINFYEDQNRINSVSSQSLLEQGMSSTIMVFHDNKGLISFLLLTLMLIIVSILFICHYIRLDRLMIIVKNKEKQFNLTMNKANLLFIKVNDKGELINYNSNFIQLINNKETLVNDLFQLISDKAIVESLLVKIRSKEMIINFNTKLINSNGQTINIIWNSLNDHPNDNLVDLVGIDVTQQINLREQLNHLQQTLSSQSQLVEKNKTELTENKEKIWHLAYIDSLTKLYNRTYFIEKLNEFLMETEQTGALIHIDIDQFNYLNLVLGPSLADQIIQTISSNLLTINKNDSLMAKLSSDEFIILLKNITENNIINFLNELININQFTVKNEGITMDVSVTAGVTLIPEHGRLGDDLLKKSAIALKYAKKTNKGSYSVYHSSMEVNLVGQMNMDLFLRKGLTQNRFVLFYQPQYQMKTGKLMGFEALLRMRNDDNQMITPDLFISIAEETRLIIPIGYWVLENALSYIKQFNDKQGTDYTISVNVSVIQLLQDDFVDQVMQIVKRTNVDPRLIEIEITETSLMHFDEMHLIKLKKLKEFGIHIALDDFGTGYSSLIYFKKTTNLSILKIDKEFIKDMTQSEHNHTIVEAIIYLGHKLNYTVVAEGVESKEQYLALKKLGCDRMQGYLGSKPLPPADLIERLNGLKEINI
jgi:diguanylate cyclase (GGDEF)-like protein